MLDAKLLTLLVCPADRGPLVYVDDMLVNPRLRRVYRIEDGIPVLLIHEAVDLSDDELAALMAKAEQADRQ
ncbi:MAG: uncharacterized protein QOH60_1420 [Mycobacterium sp.]|jgi:uncharacterized protein YbaR (Trm112 family)|nr:uncharacterized protein [Mycobacterium sp.]